MGQNPNKVNRCIRKMCSDLQKSFVFPVIFLLKSDEKYLVGYSQKGADKNANRITKTIRTEYFHLFSYART